MANFARQLDQYRLTTAEILYRMPDHQSLLQSYIWQEYDIAPEFPELHKFLDFWERNLDGPLHSVKIAHTEIITPGDSRFADTLQTLH
jgi:uncharacterized protein Usg